MGEPGALLWRLLSDFMGVSRALGPCWGHGDSHSPPATHCTPGFVPEQRKTEAREIPSSGWGCRSLTLMDGSCGRGTDAMAHTWNDKVILLRAPFLPVRGATTKVQTSFGRERGIWGKDITARTVGDTLGLIQPGPSTACALAVAQR